MFCTKLMLTPFFTKPSLQPCNENHNGFVFVAQTFVDKSTHKLCQLVTVCLSLSGCLSFFHSVLGMTFHNHFFPSVIFDIIFYSPLLYSPLLKSTTFQVSLRTNSMSTFDPPSHFSFPCMPSSASSCPVPHFVLPSLCLLPSTSPPPPSIKASQLSGHLATRRFTTWSPASRCRLTWAACAA